MPVEIEAKFKVDSHDAIRAALPETGAERLGRVLETNHIFDNKTRTLLSSGQGLRVRHCRAEDGDDPPATLTYKGPRQPGPMKTREEIEVRLDDPAAGRMLLERLGFVEAVRFEKRRESWRLGDCRIELDEVPHLGCYVEIEGPDESAICRAQEKLGLGKCEIIRASYIALLVEYCQAAGLPCDRITFD